MNTRPITEDDLNGFIDSRLDAWREAEVAAWLETHSDVAQRVAQQRQQRDLLRKMLAPIAEEPAPPQLDLARLIEARRRPATFWRGAIAATLLLCLGGTGGWALHGLNDSPARGVAALAQEAADSYAVYAPDLVRPVELRASDSIELLEWMSQRLGQPVSVPDLGAAGYRLMGGRIVTTAHGPAALFMYDDDHGARLVMLARPMAAEQNARMTPHTQGALNGFAWADKGLGYSVIGQAPADAVHSIADEVRRQLSRES